MAAVSFDFTGKRVLVTGAGRGIGKDICIALAKAGAQIFALSKTKENLDALVSEYPSIRPVCVDLSNWKETRKAVESIGPIDLLVNNAVAVNHHPFLEVPEDAIDQQFDVNLKAVINVSQVVARGMIERKYPGSIVNISSQASLRAVENHTVYCAAKAALDSLTRTMALELGPHQIRVNAVNPTVVLTETGKKLWSDEVVASAIKERIPLRRFAGLSESERQENNNYESPRWIFMNSTIIVAAKVIVKTHAYHPYVVAKSASELPGRNQGTCIPSYISEVSEVVGPVLYLLSDSSSMVTGALLPIDGGMTV